MFDVGDDLLRPEDEPYGMFDLGNDIRIERIISQLLRRLNEQARFEMLKDAMSNGSALSLIVREVISLGQEQGKYGADESTPKEEWIQSEQHLKELEDIALKRLRDAVEQNSLLQVPKLPEKLDYWQNLAGEEEVKQWVQKIIVNDEQLVSLLEKLLEKDFSEDESDATQEIGYRLDSKWLESFVEPSSIIDRVRSLDENSGLTEDQKTAIAQFIREYETGQLSKDADDPS